MSKCTGVGWQLFLGFSDIEIVTSNLLVNLDSSYRENPIFSIFRAHLANHDELISKSFQGSQGRAYLFNSVVNIGCGQAEERVLLTGLHAVADIYCDCCKTVLGWKYEQAYESSQKYKEGKFIIELAHMIKENGWENESWFDHFYA